MEEVAAAEKRLEEEEEEVTPPTMVTNRGHRLPFPTPSSLVFGECQSPMLAPWPYSSRGKAITFSHKRGRGNH